MMSEPTAGLFVFDFDADRLGYHCERGAHDTCRMKFGGLVVHFGGEKVQCSCTCHALREDGKPTDRRSAPRHPDRRHSWIWSSPPTRRGTEQTCAKCGLVKHNNGYVVGALVLYLAPPCAPVSP